MKKPRKRIQKSVPMLVMRTLHNTDMETRERMAVTALSHGFASTKHYDTLLELINLMLIAGQRDKKRKYIGEYAENIVQPVLTSVKDRYLKTGKLGVSAEELKVLREMIDRSKDFWLTQTTSFYNECVAELNAFYMELNKKPAEAGQSSSQGGG